MKGKFITIEGGEGAGKTSALSTVKEWLRSHHIEYVMTREPGGTPMAEEIRELVLRHREEQVAPEAELMLVFAARVQHIQQCIKPALEAGKWVISDRFLDSSYVYQGIARGLDEALIDRLVESFMPHDLPDTTLLLDVPVDIGLSRVANRGDANRLDGESLAFHENVRAGFLQRAKQSPTRIKTIDAAQQPEAVQRQIITTLDALLSGECL